MRIGYYGRSRTDEIILALGLIVIAIRTALPISTGTSVYGYAAVKLSFAAAMALPAVWLLSMRALEQRRHALLAVFGTYAYVGVLVVVVDWTRFGTASALFTCAGLTMHLYYVAAREIKWSQADSSQRPSP